MGAFFYVIWRLIVTLFAFLCGSVAAGFVLGREIGIILHDWLLENLETVEAAQIADFAWFGPIILAGLMLAVVGALPFGLFIIISEAYRLRGIIYYMLASAAMIVGGVMAFSNLLADMNTGTLSYFLAAGFVGGFVYWLIAGRSAGFTTDPAQSK